MEPDFKILCAEFDGKNRKRMQALEDKALSTVSSGRKG